MGRAYNTLDRTWSRHMRVAVSHLHLSRFRRIAEVLARHGLGYIVDALGLGRFLPPPLRFRAAVDHSGAATAPEHVRLALEELGATFVKLGQVLSTRGDLLPSSYRLELARLQEHGLAVPLEAVQETFTAELGSPLEEVFATFKAVPLAAGSIGRAHAATPPSPTGAGRGRLTTTSSGSSPTTR
jgi:ubiquinone biosynthesis protein